MKFGYYYGEESEQYSFFRIPKMFFTDELYEKLSLQAKLLYGLMLDRMALSKNRGWYDENSRVYIKYTSKSIAADMHINQKSAIKYMKELQEFGLIIKLQQAGQPDIIYVMNFTKIKQVSEEGGEQLIGEDTEANQNSEAVQREKMHDFNIKEKCNETTTVKNGVLPNLHTHEQRCYYVKNNKPDFQSHNCRMPVKHSLNAEKTRDFETEGNCGQMTAVNFTALQNLQHCKTYSTPKFTALQNLQYHDDIYNNNKNNKDNNINNQSVSQSILSYQSDSEGQTDMTEDEYYEQLVKSNIEYDNFMQDENNREWYEEYYNIILEVVMRKVDKVFIAGSEWSHNFVKSRFLKITASDMLYVHDRMEHTASDIKNIKSYLITALFNAPTTNYSYWSSRAHYDMITNRI